MTVNKKQLITTRTAQLLLRSLLILNFGLALSYLISWFFAARQNIFWKADFTTFYTGWEIVRRGLGEQLYNFNLQTRVQLEILQGRSFSEGLLPFNYPPGIILLFTPLSQLSLTTAFYLWSVLQGVCLAWLIVLLWRLTSGWNKIERFSLIGIVIALPSMLPTLLGGTFSILMLIGLLQYFKSVRDRRELHTAFWLFIGLIKPQFFLAAGVVMIVIRRWHTVVYTILMSLGMVWISSMLLGWNIWPSYLEKLRLIMNYFGIYGFEVSKMYNFRGALTVLLGNQQAQLINLLTTIAMFICFIVVAFIWRKNAATDHPIFELKMALTLTLGLFFCLHLLPQDGLLYVAPAFLFYEYLRKSDLPRVAFGAFALSCPFFLLYSMFNLTDQFFLPIPIIASLILMVWLIMAWVNAAHSEEHERKMVSLKLML